MISSHLFARFLPFEVLSDPSGAAVLLDLAAASFEAPETAPQIPVALALPGAAACATARRLRAFVVPWRRANVAVFLKGFLLFLY